MKFNNLAIYIDESNFDPFRLQELKQIFNGQNLINLGRENKGLQVVNDEIAIIVGISREISSYKLILKKNKYKFFFLLGDSEDKNEGNEYYFSWDNKDYFKDVLNEVIARSVEKNKQLFYEKCQKHYDALDKSLKKIDYRKWDKSKLERFFILLNRLKRRISIDNIDKVYDVITSDDVNDVLKNYGVYLKKIKRISELSDDSIILFDSVQDKDFYVIDCQRPLKDFIKDQNGEMFIYGVVNVMEHISLTRKRALEIKSLQQKVENHKKEIDDLDIPVALMNASGDFLLYNNEFSKLRILPKECFDYQNKQKIEKEKQLLEVVRHSFLVDNKELVAFIFRKNSFSKGKSGATSYDQEELGIVASSIAHEINNPLAGILASLTLISLEDGMSDSQLEQCQDMQKSAKRCKELIDVFLGFSRADINRKCTSLSLKSSFDQAMNLIRFRMAETNIRLEFRIGESEESDKDFNSSIMSMIFYLIFNDLLTAYGHHSLITNKSKEAPVIAGNLNLKDNKIILSLKDVDFNLSQIGNARLLQQLMNSQGLELSF